MTSCVAPPSFHVLMQGLTNVGKDVLLEDPTILSAFGCGAFCKPAVKVEALYKQAIETYKKDLDVIVFAIYYPGSGPDSHKPFQDILCPRDD